MTDDNPAVSTAELQMLIDRAPLEAAARGLFVLPASLAREAEVLFVAPEVSLDQALDVAVAGGAPFVMLEIITFDAAELSDEDIPQRLRTLAGAHDGETSSLIVRWLSAGVPYSFWARATWNRDLTDEVETWQEDAEAEADRQDALERERVQELVRIAVADAGVRAAKTNARKPLVEALIRGQAEKGDSPGVISRAVSYAIVRVREAHTEAFAILDATLDRFLDDLYNDPDWTRQRWVTDKRQAALRRFTMTRTGGWAPTDAWLKATDKRSSV